MHYSLPLPAGLRRWCCIHPAESADRMREERRTVKKGCGDIEVWKRGVCLLLDASFNPTFTFIFERINAVMP